MYQDLSTRHDCPVQKAIVDLPISMKLVESVEGSEQGSRRVFSENVVVAETSYQMLEVLEFCDWEGFEPITLRYRWGAVANWAIKQWLRAGHSWILNILGKVTTWKRTLSEMRHKDFNSIPFMTYLRRPRGFPGPWWLDSSGVRALYQNRRVMGSIPFKRNLLWAWYHNCHALSSIKIFYPAVQMWL